MILSKFKKPKWQHRDPEVRRVAIDSVTDVDTLKNLAAEDEDASVRLAAVRKIDDLALLNSLAQQDKNSEVREQAQQRFKQFLTGHKDNSPPLESRLAWLGQITDSKLIEHLATKGQEAELRLAAVKRVEREALLGDIASQDSVSAVRLVAIEKIEQKSTLERVYKATRSTDKQVSRLAKDKLDRLIEQEERPAKVQAEGETVCKRLEMLGRGKSSWTQEHLEYEQLHIRWQAIAAESPSELNQRYQKAERHFLVGWRTYEQARIDEQKREQALVPIRAEKERLCSMAEALLSELQAQHRLTEADSETFTHRLQALPEQWQAQAALPDSSENTHWQSRFEQALNAATRIHTQLQNLDHLAQQLAKLCQKAEHALTQAPKPAKLKQLQEQWQGLSIPTPAPQLVQELVARFQQAIQQFEQRLAQQVAQRDQLVAELKTDLQQMEVALEKGELHTALPLEQHCLQLFEQINGLPTSFYKTLEARLQKAAGRIRELRSWESWGTYVEREQLCEEIEQLADRTDDDPEETARLIRQAQEQWKKLGSAGHSQSIWERFNKACNEAYKPCQSFFEQQANQRQGNLQAKEDLCVALETFAASVDWEQPDWKTIHHNVREFEKNWHNIGPTDRKTRKPLKKRFKQAMQLLEPKLEQERRRNQQFRESLIEKANATHNVDSTHDAIEQVKSLQAQWLVTVPSDRRIERQLWKTFRSTCDVVFERRKQQQEERRREQQDQLTERENLCQQVEALAAMTDTDEALATDVRAELRKIQLAWRESAPLPRRQVEGLDKRFRTACEHVDMQIQAQSAAAARAQLNLLKQKALLCHTLESLPTGDRAQQVDEARVTWANFPTLEDHSDEQLIASRFEQACQGVAIALDNTLQKQRETLCIRMEILAAVESPPEAVEARMAYQVARLSEAMSGGGVVNKDKMVEAQEIERDWYLLSPATIEHAATLEQRFTTACNAFYQHN